MRVAMLTYSTRPRGGVVHALKLAERLERIGIKVSLHSLARDDDGEGLAGYFRPVAVPFSIYPYSWHPDLVTRLERMIQAYADNLPLDAEIYHAQDCVGGTALARMKSEGKITAPVFRTIHHVDSFSDPTLFEFEKRAVRSADHRFVVSKFWKKALREEYGYTSTITYNGIDVEDFGQLPPRRSRNATVLFVGGLEPRKGLEYLLHAMEQVVGAMPDVRLTAVAKGGFRGTDEWQWFLTLADRLGIKNNFEFYESVSQEKLLQMYSDCDILVLPSKTEGWGLALMEAMACGKAVVASRAGGIPELVRNGVEGILVPPGDVRGLSRAITRLLSDQTLRERMGKAGTARVSAFSWDRTAEIVARAYRASLATPSRTRS
jgi:glycosyltransferase involved in cell wall biosynthesis